MGLLDDLLGGLAGQGMRGRPQEQQGGGKGGILMALLPVVLAMLANRGSQSGAPTRMNPAPGGGGGLGDVLGQVLGGALGGGGSAGGLGGLLEQFQRAGFGAEADSWVGRGSNMPIPPHAIQDIFGREGVEQIAQRAGITEDEASRGLSELLPEVVDRVTPDGQVPDFDALTGSVDDLARRFGVR